MSKKKSDRARRHQRSQRGSSFEPKSSKPKSSKSSKSSKSKSSKSSKSKPSKPKPSKPKKDAQRHLLTGSLLTGDVFSAAYADEDSGAVDTYLEAHSLLPATACLDDEATIHRRISQALTRIADRQAGPDDLLEAIVVLGHVPSSIALAALQQHAESDRPHADVAKIAADECLGWMADLDQLARILGSEAAPPPSMLN